MMNGTLTIEEVNDLIEQQSDEAADAIEQLPTVCQQDQNGRTPLNVAIQFQNHQITKLLAASAEAINFSPKIDEDLLAPVKHTVSGMLNERRIGETEKHLARVFGPRMCLQRTPLHQACRYANLDAIALLISSNASMKEKDILGLTAFELCTQFGGSTGANHFITCCAKHKKSFDVTDLTLRMLCSDATLYQQAIQRGRLDMKAKRFAFSLACALLDRRTMEEILSQGLNINKSMNDEFSPVLEVCTSRLLSLYEHPEAPRLAQQYAAANGPATAAIHIDNDAILNAESLEDIEALFGDAVDEADAKQTKATSYVLSDDERQAQLSQRLALIDYLAEQGLDPGVAEDKAPYGFVGDIVSTNSTELLQALVDKRFRLAPEKGNEDADLYAPLSRKQYEMVDALLQLGHQWGDLKREHPDLVQQYFDWKKEHATVAAGVDLSKRKPAQASESVSVTAIRDSEWTWELTGESILLAKTDPELLSHNKPAVVRVTHNNLYGPVDGVQLFVGIGKPDLSDDSEDPQTVSEWHPMTLVEELLLVDGEDVARSAVSEPVYGETPWEATYECKLTFRKGEHTIRIKLVSEIQGLTGVISDWNVTVK